MLVKHGFMERWGGFVAVALALGICFSTSSVPTPLYPIYQSEWQLPPSAISYIFAAYMVAVLVALMCFGRISDSLGRFQVIVSSLLMLLAGLVLSAVAQGVVLLIVARVIIGFGNGLLTTAGALALAEAHPRRDKRVASTTSSLAISVGFGFGPVIGGLIAQVGMAPLVLPYLVVFAVASVCLWMAVRSRHQLSGPAGVRPRISIRPQMALPARARRPVFLLACIAGFVNFTAGSLFASQVPALLRQALPWNGPAAVGLAFVFMAAAVVLVQLVWRQIEPFKGLTLGMLSLLAALGALAYGLTVDSLLSLAAALVFLGMGQGFTFMTSAVIAGMYSDEHRRAANMSTYFFSAYIGATVPVIGVGILADHVGLMPAIYVFCAVVASWLAILGWSSARHAWRISQSPC